MPDFDLIKGTLDMLILKTLNNGSLHGYAVAQKIHVISDNVLKIEEGSLYPALHRMEERGWVQSEWGQSENNRRAKYYSLTKKGKKQLENEASGWAELCSAIAKVMNQT